MSNKWDIQEAASSCYHVFAWVDGAVDGLKKHFGRGLSKHIFIGKKEMGYEYFLSDDLDETGKFVIRKLTCEKKRKEIMGKAGAYRKELDMLFSEFKKMDMKKLSIDGLKELYLAFNRLFYDYSGLMMFPETVEPAVDKYLMKYFKLLKKDFSVLTTPPNLSFVQKEKLSLLKILGMIPKEKRSKEYFKNFYGGRIHKLILAHIEEFAWLRVSYNDASKLEMSDVLARAEEIILDVESEKKKLVNFEKEIRDKKKEIIKKYKLSSETIDIIKVSDFTGMLHDERKEYVLKWLYYCSFVLAEIARRYGYRYDQIKFLPRHEIEKIFETGKFEKKLLDDAYACCVYERTPGKSRCFLGEEGLKYEKDHFKCRSETGKFQLQGMCVSQGKVSGRVKVIYLKQHFAKFKEGDILVATMTRPEFVPLMAKAAAIVTDQGGVTSHAAIVARELKIPCIVGTRDATKVLKDDDLVEVNANHGIVRILKR